VQRTQALFQTEHSSRLGRDDSTEDLAWRQLRVHRLELGAFLDKRITTLFSSSDGCGALVLITAPETIFLPSSVSQQYSTPR
jgi:hypothetical protein